MGQLLDVGYSGIWLLLASVPGIAMLTWLAIRLLRTHGKSGTPVDPPAGVEPVRLEAISRHSLEQLNEMSESLGRALKVGRAFQQAPAAIARLPEPPQSVTAGQELIALTEKMYQLAELTSHLLEKRRALAGTALEPELTDDNLEPSKPYLSFLLDAKRFAISTSTVCALVEGSQRVSKAATTSRQRGAIRFGTTLVPVVDLGTHLTGLPVQPAPSNCVVILEMGGERPQKVGVLVDAVSGVLHISPERIEQTSGVNSGIGADFILGSTTIDHYSVTVLDIERGLSANEFVLLHRVSQPVVQDSALT